MKKKQKKAKGKSSSSKGGIDFGKYLRGLNKNLDKAKEKAASGGFEEYDDGRYAMRAVDAKIGQSKSKRVQVVITWKFMDGEYKGKEKLDFEGLTEDHLEYLLRKLDGMGYDTSELEDLESELKDILDDIKKSKPKCRVRLKTKGEFQNVYVDKLIGDDEEDESDEEEDEDEDDDEEEDDKKKSKKKKGKKKDDDDEEEEDDEEEDDDDDEDSDDDDEDSDDEEEDEDEDDDEEEDDKKKSKKKKGKKKDDDDDEEEEDDEEEDDEEEDDDEEVEDEIDVVVGSIVKAETKKSGKFKGEVVELFEAEGKVLIKTDKGKTVKIPADKITSVEESPASSVKSKKKGKKKSKK